MLGGVDNFDEVVELMAHYFCAPENIIVRRIQFWQRCQWTGKSVKRYVADLGQLASEYRFGALQDEMIWDQLAEHVRCPAAWSRLLTYSGELTLATAIEVVQQFEATEVIARDLSGKPTPTLDEPHVKALTLDPENEDDVEEDEYTSVVKIRTCKNFVRGDRGQETDSSAKTPTVIHTVSPETDGCIYCTVSLDGGEVSLLVNTGLVALVLNLVTVKSLFPYYHISRVSAPYYGYGRNKLAVVGSVVLSVVYKSRTMANVQVVVTAAGSNIMSISKRMEQQVENQVSLEHGTTRVGMGVDNIVSILIFGMVFVLGVIGNTLVITVLARSKPGQPRSTTNIFILNLQRGGPVYLLFCIPFQSTIYMLDTWVLGAFICKFIHYFFTVSMLVSIFTLSAMSVDRYVAIVHARKSSSIRVERHAMVGVVLIWTLSLVMAAPVAHYQSIVEREDNNTYCWEDWPGHRRKIYVMCTFVFGIRAASRPISVCYAKTAQTVLVVVVVFCLSWLPHHIVHLWVEFGSFPLNQASFVFRMVAHCLAYSNSSVNPIIYAFLSENFRNSYKQVFWCRTPSECPLNDTRDQRSKMETAPSTNISVSYKGHDSQICKML
ncbi:LOW QUALITY PROTEIN: uncharacterized protein galr1a [Pholidichthys leucotaenia]